MRHLNVCLCIFLLEPPLPCFTFQPWGLSVPQLASYLLPLPALPDGRNFSWLISSNNYKLVPARIWKAGGKELVGPQKWQATPFQGPVWEDQRGEGISLPLWAPNGGLKIWKYIAVWLSHWFCTVGVNSSNLPSGPFSSSVLPLLSRVWVCVFIYSFVTLWAHLNPCPCIMS